MREVSIFTCGLSFGLASMAAALNQNSQWNWLFVLFIICFVVAASYEERDR